MGSSTSKGRNGQVDVFFGSDPGADRWRKWACGHNRSAEYDGSSTIVRRSWFGRAAAPFSKAPAR